MTKDLEPVEKGGEVVLNPELQARMERLGMSAKQSITSDDVQLPGLTLVQATSGYVEMGARPGQIIHTLSNEAFDEIEFVVAHMGKSRIMFGSEIGEPPKCTSHNALDGYGEQAESLIAQGLVGPTGGGDCTRCPEAKIDFRRGIKGNCALQYNYMGVQVGEDVDIAHELPCGITMQRTSIKIATILNSLIMGSEYPWSYVYNIKSKRVENDKGKFYIWQVARGRKATVPEMLKAMEVAELVQKSTVRVDTGLDAQVVEQPVAAGAGATDDTIPF